ncbi:MAG: glycosyltransferase family 2 protein [Candidatus Daviesbacteria bacterium]|nr:glycosyltransferase family 2 protein [Candidatus Daviesbacteria bacterium]
MSITIFFPCYNDSKTIGKLVEDAFNTVRKLTTDYEILVINDGSTDSSAKVLKKVSKKHREVKVITHEKNLGYGTALRTGFQEASKDLIFYTDGDGQYDIKELPLLLSIMTEDVNFVNGIKMTRGDLPHRIFFGNLHKFIARWLFWLPVYDVDCDFRLIRKDIIKKIKLESSSGSICVELVKKAQRVGAKFRQISVHHYERKHGTSQFFRPRKIITTYIDLAYLWTQLMIYDRLKNLTIERLLNNLLKDNERRNKSEQIRVSKYLQK